jgi:hypothetical protein
MSERTDLMTLSDALAEQARQGAELAESLPPEAAPQAEDPPESSVDGTASSDLDGSSALETSDSPPEVATEEAAPPSSTQTLYLMPEGGHADATLWTPAHLQTPDGEHLYYFVADQGESQLGIGIGGFAVYRGPSAPSAPV